MTSYAALSDGNSLREGWLANADPIESRASEIEAVVEHGDARGRTMGFPTANMHLKDGFPLRFGVYAVRVIIKQDGCLSRHKGVANYGIRPMYRITKPLLEVHLLDFDGDLYDLTLRVSFIAFIRPELLFPSLGALISQIRDDALRARDLLER